MRIHADPDPDPSETLHLRMCGCVHRYKYIETLYFKLFIVLGEQNIFKGTVERDGFITSSVLSMKNLESYSFLVSVSAY
jgi:hypothetical protein